MKAHDTIEPKNAEQAAKDGGADQAAAAGALEVEPLSIEEQLAAKEKEARENWDRFLRERADLENFRKRANREKEELLNYGYKSLIEEVLPVLDNLERALSHASEDGLPALVEGIRMTHCMLLAALRKFNVRQIEAVGTLFDPAFHQAMAQVPTDEYPPNTVVEEYQKGYMLKDRLLRPAMVSVSTEIKDVNRE
jgi:molecular chaperone GrpE